MIYVDRAAVPVPDFINDKHIHKAQVAAERFYRGRSKQSRRQERFGFPYWNEFAAAMREPLNALFGGKCAYCETPLPSGIDLFRPRAEAVGLIPRSAVRAKAAPRNWLARANRESDRDGYWWLAYEWENAYPVCAECNRNKASNFPVIGSRAEPGTRGEALRSELALLLDPCVDHPEEYLVFDEEGHVASRRQPSRARSRFFNVDRGAVTIDVLGLNRPALVEARRRVARQMIAAARQSIGQNPSPATLRNFIESMNDPEASFVALRRQLVASIAARAVKGQLKERLDAVADFGPQVSEAVKGEARKSRRRKAVSIVPPAKKAPSPRKQRTLGIVTAIHIQDFKTIRDLKLEMPAELRRSSDPSRGDKGRIGWKVLLGENGVGKSSILQAVAFALMGRAFLKKYLHDFKLKPFDLLRKTRGDHTVKQARIVVEFSTGYRTELVITRQRAEYVSEPPTGLFIRGYGATRLLPRRNTDRVRVMRGQIAKVTNLFDPAKPVFNVDGWLTRIARQKEFGSVALSLKDLLSLPGFAKIQLRNKKLTIPMENLKHSVDELSAGYESVLVMAADIMAGCVGRNQDFRYAPGIVLLDEIDAHLHPRWKMRIVDSLRSTFSSMQFIVTTHEPLCLRGVEKGEVAVLKRVGKEIAMLEDLPAPSSLRVDQLLTSNFFGLGSTIDPKMETAMNDYYRLLAKPGEALTSDEKRRLAELKSEVTRYEYRLMTNSPREELLYEAIDRYMAKDLSLRGAARNKLPRLREDTQRQVALLWQQAEASGGGNG